LHRTALRRCAARALLCLLSLAAAGVLLPAARADEPYEEEFVDWNTVRVAIAKNTARMTIDSEGVSIRAMDEPVLLLQVEHHFPLHIIGRKGGFEINGTLYTHHGIVVRSESGLLNVGGNKRLRSPLYLVQEQPGKDNRFTLINHLPLSHYLYGLINKEVIKTWPMEVKKAMSVAARTYTLYRKMNPPNPHWDLGDTALDQVYGGFDAEDAQARAAVDATDGEILTWQGEPIAAYYHSTCGGHTASGQAVWNSDLPYLRGTACPYCTDSPRYHWTYLITAEKLARIFDLPARSIRGLEVTVTQRGESGHARQVRLSGPGVSRTLSGEQFRGALGYSVLWSTKFTVKRSGGSFLFKGRGSGHGVGLCQWGAFGMAKSGKEYWEILEFYYPGAVLKRIQ